MDTEPTVGVSQLKALLEAFNDHDLNEVMTFFTEDAVLQMPRGLHPWGERAEGQEEVRKMLAIRFDSIPDVHYGDDRHLVCGARGVSEWLLTGTSRDGTPIRVRGCDLFEFQGGKISRKDSYWKIVV